MPDELDRDHQSLAPPPGSGETPPPLAGHSAGCVPEHGLRAGAGGDAPPARDTRPDRATRFIETTRGILAYSEVAPLLAERVLGLETALYHLEFASRAFDEQLVAEFHRRICHDLVPDLTCPGSSSPRNQIRNARPIFAPSKRLTAPTGSRSLPSGNTVSCPHRKTHETLSHPT